MDSAILRMFWTIDERQSECEINTHLCNECLLCLTSSFHLSEGFLILNQFKNVLSWIYNCGLKSLFDKLINEAHYSSWHRSIAQLSTCIVMLIIFLNYLLLYYVHVFISGLVKVVRAMYRYDAQQVLYGLLEL